MAEKSSKKKLTWREYNLILTVLGIAIVLAAYFLGYSKYSEKNTALEEEIGTRKAYLTELNDCYNNLTTYESGIAQAKKSISSNLSKLPAGIKDEDFLLYLMEANRAVGADLQTVDFQSSSLIAQFECYVGDEVKNVSGYRTGTTSSGTLTYNQLKEYLQYIYERTNNTTFVDSISIAYEAESARLNSTVSLSKFYVDYDGAEYSATPIPSNVPQGTRDPFGTANTPATTQPSTSAPTTAVASTTAA